MKIKLLKEYKENKKAKVIAIMGINIIVGIVIPPVIAK